MMWVRVIAHGGGRTTKDIDLLIDAGPENVTRAPRAPDPRGKAIDDVADDDVARYTVSGSRTRLSLI